MEQHTLDTHEFADMMVDETRLLTEFELVEVAGSGIIFSGYQLA